jgi:hypothetical protein
MKAMLNAFEIGCNTPFSSAYGDFEDVSPEKIQGI